MATDAVVLEHAKVENGCCKKGKGPGYATPLEAMAGPKEALIYVTCIYTGNFFFTLLFSPLLIWAFLFNCFLIFDLMWT